MGERGSASILVIGMLLVALAVSAIAVDLTRWAGHVREAAFAADSGAMAGGGIVNAEALRRGELRLDQTAAAEAERVALLTRASPSRSAVATVTGAEVCVTVRQTFSPGLTRWIGAGDRVAVGTACASARQG